MRSMCDVDGSCASRGLSGYADCGSVSESRTVQCWMEAKVPNVSRAGWLLEYLARRPIFLACFIVIMDEWVSVVEGCLCCRECGSRVQGLFRRYASMAPAGDFDRVVERGLFTAF